MPTQDTLESGESLSSIAQQNGFRDRYTIYNALENAGFRQKRPEQNLIVAGDVITIPDKADKAVQGASNAAVNTGKIGILVAGNFEPSLHHEDTLTTGQISKTELPANELKAAFPTITRLVGHRDLKTTECPGDDLYGKAAAFRAATGLAP